MTTEKDIYRTSGEKYCPFTGSSTPAFIPLSAGITYEDPRYYIHRVSSSYYVFEYVLSGAGYVELNAETVELTAGDGYILCPCTRHHYYSAPRRPWRKVWFNVQGDLVAHLMGDYQLKGNCCIQGGYWKESTCSRFWRSWKKNRLIASMNWLFCSTAISAAFPRLTTVRC